MKRLLQQQELLLYYDGIQLFLGRDQLDTIYICVLEEYSNDGDLYLCIPISHARLNSFYNEDIDLRSIYSQPEIDEFFTVRFDDPSRNSFKLCPINKHEIPDEWLPESGFYFSKDSETDHKEEEIVSKSQQKNRAIIYLSLNPPEARSEPKINANNLAEALNLYQTLVKRAYYRAKRGLNMREDIQELIDKENQYKLEAYATSPGSFTIHLQAQVPGDLLGYTDIAKALQRIDLITESLDDPQKALIVMKENKGHLASSYLRLLEYIIQNEAPISYKWSIPEFNKPVSLSIPRNQAIRAYELLTKVEELGMETVELLGRLTKVDLRRRSWSLVTEEKKRTYNGVISKNSDVTLRGVVMETMIYRFICEERIEEVTGIGLEKTQLYLIHYDTVS